MCPLSLRYDRHREQILHGSQSYADESLDVFQYFSASCYRGYDDSGSAFYAVYREVFEKLAAEDLEFMDSDDEADIPCFGNAQSDYEEVVGPFYAYWQSYCTKKSYSWLCQHNLTEIRDRRLLRHVEKDTKKLAAKAKKERNDEVRALVAFVKKRDRRVVEYRRVLEERAEVNRAKQQEKRMEQLRKNRQEVEEAMRQQQKNGIGGDSQAEYEKQLKRMERAYGSDSGSEEESTDDDDDVDEVSEQLENGATLEDMDEEQEDEYIDHLYCVACNKSFKNDSSMRNHESSKKHRDNLERIRIEMLADEEAHNAGGHSDSVDDDEEDENDETDEINSNVDDSDVVDEANNPHPESSAEEIQLVSTPEQESIKSVPQSKKARRRALKKTNAEPLSEQPDVVVIEPTRNASDDDEELVSSTKATKKSRRRAKQTIAPSLASEPLPSHSTSAAPKLNGNHGRSNENGEEAQSDSSNDGLDRWTERKEKRANAKKSKANRTKKPAIDDLESVDVDHTCVTCAAVFESKNKLFAHLKAANHGVYIEGKGVIASRDVLEAVQAAAAGQSSSGRGKKSRRKL